MWCCLATVYGSGYFPATRTFLGRSLVLDEEPYRIIGVLPGEALFPDRAEVWVPLPVDPTQGLTHGWYAAAGQKDNEITAPILTPLRARYLGDYHCSAFLFQPEALTSSARLILEGHRSRSRYV